MKKESKKEQQKARGITHSIFSWKTYGLFLLLTMFVCSCSLLLYGGFRNQYHGGHEEILVPLLMIGNIIFLTFLVCLADGIRRKLVIEKPVKEILEAVEQISRGNFGYRAPVLHSGKKRNEFDLILEGINQMAEELGNVETLQTDFISNVSHELKTPLAVIQNYASVLGSRGLEEEQRKEYTVTIVDTARRLSGLVTNILRLNRLENQEIYPKAQKYPLGEQLRCCILAFEEKWEEKELEVEADIEDLDLFGDEELLEIVWNNLISNAIKFTGQGGTIRVSLHPSDDFAVVQVADTGCGMDEKTGQHIFDKFYQGDTSHAQEGNGLGLAMVRRVVDIVQGDISVESRLGKGTVFTVRIRL